MNLGDLFILSAPSGAGKTTLIRGLAKDLGDQVPQFSVSHTTRQPRVNELEGSDYHFVDEATFRDMIGKDRFLEWAEVHGRLYGTSLAEVLPRLAAGNDVILDIDVQGAERVLAQRRSLGELGDEAAKELPAEQAALRRIAVHSIFIMPPSFEVLERRLRGRSLDASEDIDGRLLAARSEVGRVGLYDYVIVNDCAEMACLVLASIIRDKRHQQKRMAATVKKILDDFGADSSSVRGR
jgi:guanylate kinase